MSATLQLLASKKAQLEQELSHLEKQVSRLTISSARWCYCLCFDIRDGNPTASCDTCSCMKRKVTTWEQSTPSMAMSSRCVQSAITCDALSREDLHYTTLA